MSHVSWNRSPIARIRLLAIAIAALTFAGCGASTTIEQSWTAPNARYERLHNVVTLFISRDGATRRVAEDKMARALAARGVRATPAYAVLTDTDPRDLKQTRAKLRALGYDGVVTMRLVDREHQLQYVPPMFDDYWGPAWGGAWPGGYYSPGYAYTETVVRMESTAYSLRNNQLLWSALSKTVDPGSSKRLINDVTKIVAEQLTRRGVIV
jgi:hypothetical protein